MAELDLGTEDAAVHRESARRRVREAHQPRLPMRPHQDLQHAEGHAYHQLGGLAHRGRPFGVQLFANHDEVADLLELEYEDGDKEANVAADMVRLFEAGWTPTQWLIASLEAPERAQARDRCDLRSTP